MRDKNIRLTVDLSGIDLDAIERAARRMGSSPAEYVRYAALRLANQDAALDLLEQRSTATGSLFPSRRSLRPLVRRAAMPTIEMVRQLQTHLGVQLLAITVDATPAEVKRWADEESEPPPAQECRLREAHEVWQLVVSVESPQTARAWWMGMKDGLEDLSPAEAIALDRAGDVVAVARYFLEAG